MLADARAQLGEETFQLAWAEGKAMNFDQAIEWVLQSDASEGRSQPCGEVVADVLRGHLGESG